MCNIIYYPRSSITINLRLVTPPPTPPNSIGFRRNAVSLPLPDLLLSLVLLFLLYIEFIVLSVIRDVVGLWLRIRMRLCGSDCVFRYNFAQSFNSKLVKFIWDTFAFGKNGCVTNFISNSKAKRTLTPLPIHIHSPSRWLSSPPTCDGNNEIKI